LNPLPPTFPPLDGYALQTAAGLQLTMPPPQERETDISNAFGVTTPYADGVGAAYFETQGVPEVLPYSAVDPVVPSARLPLVHPFQSRRQTLTAPAQWKGMSRSRRPSTADNAPNGLARPRIQTSKHGTRPDSQDVEPDYDEMVGVRDDSDAEARMRRLLSQLDLVTQPDSRTTREGDGASSSSTGHSQAIPPYRDTQGPSTLTRSVFSRRLDDSQAFHDPVPLHDAEHVLPLDGDIIDHYAESESGSQLSGQTSQFSNHPPQHATSRSALPRHTSAPSTPYTTAIAPQPSHGPPRAVTTGERDLLANYSPSHRKLPLIRGRYGGSEQSLRDLSRQHLRPAQAGHGSGRSYSYSSGNLFATAPVTPASPNAVLPGLVSDSISRSSSFTSTHTRLLTPTESTPPVLSGAPHALGRIDEKHSLDYNEIETAHAQKSQSVSSRTSLYIYGEAKESSKVIETKPQLKLATSSPPSGWATHTSAELSSGKHFRSAATTPASSVFDGGSITGGWSVSSGPSGFLRSTVSTEGSQRTHFRSGGSDISSFADSLGRPSTGKTNSMKEKVTPTVAMATAFAMGDTAPIGAPLSRAEKAAEKARHKAEKAAKKAEVALVKLEREREAATAELKRQETRKSEKEERQRQAEVAIARLLFGA
jgi:hypothetical protein